MINKVLLVVGILMICYGVYRFWVGLHEYEGLKPLEPEDEEKGMKSYKIFTRRKEDKK